MRPGTHALVSGTRVRGRTAPDREPTYGIRPDCTIATGQCDCPPCTQAADDQSSPLDLTGGEWVTGPRGITRHQDMEEEVTDKTLTVYRDIEQRSPEWHNARCGLVTASAVGKLLTLGRPDPGGFECTECAAPVGMTCISLRGGKPIKTMHPARHAAADAAPQVLTVADNDTSRGLITTLAAERITGHVEETPFTRDMERGVMAEPFAQDAYTERTGNAVESVGFIVRHFDGYAIGYSPDGLVGEDGLTEWKAPRAKGHINTVLADEVPAHYMPQCQTALLVTGRKWIDFVSFHGGLPLFIKRVYPLIEWHNAIEAAARAAEDAINDITGRYTEATAGLPATARIPDPYAEIAI